MSAKGTEQATPQRKQKARERGDKVRSRELLSAMAMIGGVLMLGITAKGFAASWGQVYVESIRSAGVGESGIRPTVWRMLGMAFLPIVLVMTGSFLAALMTGIVQSGGISIYPNALALKFERLNPAVNIGNLFGLRSVTRMAKSLIPATVMVAIGWSSLRGLMLPMPVTSIMRLPATFETAYQLVLKAALITLIWSAIDYFVEWRSWNDRLKMTKQEMKEEIRDAMGNPQIKMRVRQIQMTMRKRRIKADMSRASVVITNPTHYAVALEFSFETMQAPTVLAKGRDLFAAEIREEAKWLGIPLIEDPPLARSLYRLVDVDHSIPFELYATVAGILAYLYRQKVDEQRRKGRQAEEMRQRVAIGAVPGVMAVRGFGGGM
jgi:flagellar biosynthesis protein FlhB